MDRGPEGGAEEYCRQLEAYLCRKNDGHLIRIVGPAFDQVCGWAAKGVPLNVACRGIDRYFDRYYAKGPRRRPVRIEFCEADVLDVFDEWRRATGVGMWDGASAEEGTTRRAARGPSLADHLERLVIRLTSLRTVEAPSFTATLDSIVREIDTFRATARGARGAARETILTRLRQLDAEMLAAARSRLDAEAVRVIEQTAEEELAPFRDRMPAAAYAESKIASADRLLRERARLPTLALD